MRKVIINILISNCGCIKHSVSIKSIEALQQYAKRREEALIGQRFGKLIVIEHAGKIENRNNANVWKCRCDCGNITFATTSDLQSLHVKSCGCLFFLNKNILLKI